MSETVFSCGTEAADWIYNNCEKCKKYDPDSAEDTTCEFSNKVCMGFFGGAPTVEEFREYGYDGDIFFRCSQIDELSDEQKE